MTLEAHVNITNPTEYTATVPSVSIHVMCNGSLIGEAKASNLNITAGNNTDLVVRAVWEPAAGGKKASKIGRDLLSQYLSGYNTTVSLKTHALTFPSAPILGEALSKLNFSINTPRLHLPSPDPDTGDDEMHFIRDATLHFFSSTATFTLISPLQETTLFIEHINATAFYNHTEPVGVIVNDLPFAVSPGPSTSPNLPVEWSIGSGGLEKLKKAVGGELKLDAFAEVGVRIGAWRERLWYAGKGIGASVRP
jgi:hypothetical protein